MPTPVTSWLSEFIEEEVNKEDKVMWLTYWRFSHVIRCTHCDENTAWLTFER